MKRGHNRRERESDRKTDGKRGTYAGGSSRTGVRGKARGNKDGRQTKCEGAVRAERGTLHQMNECWESVRALPKRGRNGTRRSNGTRA